MLVSSSNNHFSTLPLALTVDMEFTSLITSPSLLHMCVISRLGRKVSAAMASKHFFKCGCTLEGGYLVFSCLWLSFIYSFIREGSFIHAQMKIFSFIKSIRSFVNFFIHSFIHSFVHSFIFSFIRSFIRSFIHSLSSFVHSFIFSIIHSSIHSFVHSFIRSFIHSFIHSFVHSFIRSFIHSFIHSFVHSFIRSFIHLFMFVRLFILN